MSKSDLTLYRQLAPFTADKLVDAANSLLRERGAPGVTKRTLRFYTAQKVVPSPMGSPKFARYGYEHLLALLGSRALQDQGMKLEQIMVEVEELKRGRLDRLEGLVEQWLDQGDRVPVGIVREEKENYVKETSVPGTRVVRIPLGKGATLEIRDDGNFEHSLRKAQEELEQLLSGRGV